MFVAVAPAVVAVGVVVGEEAGNRRSTEEESRCLLIALARVLVCKESLGKM